MAAAATAAAPPFYFCNVATSKREPAGRQSVSEQEAGEGRKPVASWGEGRRERGMDVSSIRAQKVEQNKAETADVHVCFLVCAYMCAYQRSAVAGKMKQDSGSSSAPSRLLPAARRFQK